MRQKYSIKKQEKTVIATEKTVVVQVKEFLAFIITLNTFVNLLNGVSIDGQWISLKATGRLSLKYCHSWVRIRKLTKDK